MSTAAFRRRTLLLTALLLLGLGLAEGARAAQFDTYKELGIFRDWVAYEGQYQGKKICFAESRPKTLDRRIAGRDLSAVRATVTDRPADKVSGEIVFQTGIKIAPNVFADADIDGNPFKLATDPSGILWLPSRNEPAFLAAMRRGLDLTTKTPVGNGGTANDTYSLRGLTAALRAIDEACR